MLRRSPVSAVNVSHAGHNIAVRNLEVVHETTVLGFLVTVLIGSQTNRDRVILSGRRRSNMGSNRVSDMGSNSVSNIGSNMWSNMGSNKKRDLKLPRQAAAAEFVHAHEYH